MKEYSFFFRGSTVSVSYQGGDQEEVIWIATLQACGRVIAVDGTVMPVSAETQAEITRSVIKSLEWVLERAIR